MPDAPGVSVTRQNRTLRVTLRGDWTLARPGALGAVDWGDCTALAFDADALGEWDSLLAATLLPLLRDARSRHITPDLSALPDGLQQLLGIAEAVPPRPPRPEPGRAGFVATWRQWIRGALTPARDVVQFIGELTLAAGRLLRGRANLRWRDFWLFTEQAGPRALGIVGLISVLVGMILAYLGAVQLQQFGAQVYVANLVSIGMAREMGALMTAIIMAGRTGAAYAAQLGAMQANDEIDALRTLGIDPMEYLVLPRTLALLLTLPLLTLYADVMGMIGGGLVAVTMDINPVSYLTQTRDSIGLQTLMIGLTKSVVFAVLVALAGCRHGLRSGHSSTAVGQATTAAVVAAIVYIIVADSVFNVACNVLGI